MTASTDTRRDFLKKAGIAGAAGVWAAPVVTSVTAAASAQTGVSTGAGCYRAQYQFDVNVPASVGASTTVNAVSGMNSNAGSSKSQSDTGSCKWVDPGGLVQNPASCDPTDVNKKDIHNSHDINPNRNCCQVYDDVNGVDVANQPGQVLDWWSCYTEDLANTGCIQITTSKGSSCPDPGPIDNGDGTWGQDAFSNGDWVQLTVNQVGACSDCWIQDAQLVVVGAKSPDSAVASSHSTSTWYKSLRWNFTNEAKDDDPGFYLVYVKFWVGCDLLVDNVDDTSPCTDNTQYFPCTQCPKNSGTLAKNF